MTATLALDRVRRSAKELVGLIQVHDLDVRHRRQLGPHASRHPRGVARPPDVLQRYSGGRKDVMNDRQWEVSAYAALVLVFVGAIAAAVVVADQLVLAI